MAISPKVLNEGEHVVMNTRTHPKALIVPFVILLVLLAIGVFSQTKIDNGTATLVIWVFLGVGALWFCVWPFLEWLTSGYAFTNRRLITRNGIITRRGHDIPLSRISDVAYELGLVDRMLGCGTLVISDASTHGQVHLHDIPQVEENQRKLNVLLHELHGGASNLDEGH